MIEKFRKETREERVMRELGYLYEQRGDFRLAEEFHKAVSPADLSEKAYKVFKEEIER